MVLFPARMLEVRPERSFLMNGKIDPTTANSRPISTVDVSCFKSAQLNCWAPARSAKRRGRREKVTRKRTSLQWERMIDRHENYELAKGDDRTLVELSRSAMGVTYRAFDVDLRCPVTLKVIRQRYLGDESARLRFLREAPRSSPAFVIRTLPQYYTWAELGAVTFTR